MPKYIFLLLFLSILLTDCSFGPSDLTQSKLPVIDLNKEYPVKRVDIHEIADVEYIPLETTDNSLIDVGAVNAISDKQIVVFDILQLCSFIFNRQGIYINTINRFGQGPEEYYAALRFDVDFKNEECFFYDGSQHKIAIYNLNGDFKRSFGYSQNKKKFNFNVIHDYDPNYLITFNDTDWPSPDEKSRSAADSTPYYLINKKDGSLKSIDKRLKIKDPVTQIFKMVKGQSGRYSLTKNLKFPYLLKNGSDFLLVNNGLDTLYNYADHKLEPVILRTPSAQSMNPPCVIAPCVYTDDWFIFKKLTMDYELGEKYDFDPRRGPSYLLNRKTKEIFQLNLYDSLLDPDIDLKDRRELMTAFPTNGELFSMHTKNQAAAFYRTSFLLEKLKEGKLKGKLKEVASRLKEDDNNVIILYKFK